MKKIHKLLVIAFLLIGTAGSLSSCSKNDDDEPEGPVKLNIPDAALASSIKIALGLVNANNDPDPAKDITEENILDLTELDVTGDPDHADIQNIAGLEKAVNLTLLNLGETQVTDINPIKGLRKIEYLRFNDTPLSDLSPIADYTSLTYFNANAATNINNISPLSKNLGLQELILRDVAMGNAGMQVIKNFTKLYRLNMRNTGVTDITVLGQLMAGGALLKTTPGASEAGGDAELDLRNNSITSFEPVRSYYEAETCINITGYPDND